MARRTLRSFDGVELSILEAGASNGPPILFLHGLGYAARVWRKQLEAPALSRFRLVALDLRGHGESDWRLDDDFGRATWAGDIAAVIDGLRLDPPTIVAWSYAGLVAADYLGRGTRHPVRAVNLVAAAVRTGFEEAYADYGSGAIPPGLLDDAPERNERADTTFVAESAGTLGFSTAEADELFSIVHSTPREVLRRLLRRHVDNTTLWAAALDVPVLLTHGTADRINLPAISVGQAERMGRARLSWYEGAGHLPFWEEPDRFNDELRSLVEGTRSPADGLIGNES